MKAVRAPTLMIKLEAGQQLLDGKLVTEVSHLTGRAVQRQRSGYSTLHPSRYEGHIKAFNTHELRLEWVVHGGNEVTIVADFDRGGVHTATITMPSTRSLL
eukprot:SAG31_NODE_3520_length_4165_cov_1.856370_5_plen_101_part_00